MHPPAFLLHWNETKRYLKLLRNTICRYLIGCHHTDITFLDHLLSDNRHCGLADAPTYRISPSTSWFLENNLELDPKIEVCWLAVTTRWPITINVRFTNHLRFVFWLTVYVTRVTYTGGRPSWPTLIVVRGKNCSHSEPKSESIDPLVIGADDVTPFGPDATKFKCLRTQEAHDIL